MPGLRLYTGNRLESLAGQLAEVVQRPPGGALQPEIVVVQSFGMQRWISLQLARRSGVCANLECPFPNAFVQAMFARVLPETAPARRLERDTMTWRIMELLPGLLERPEFALPARYLEDRDSRRLYQLAARLADTFDQYLVFRPEMVLGWEEGRLACPAEAELEGWQALLWRELVAGGDWTHRARLRQEFFQALPAVRPGVLPQRVAVFGVSSLPAFHLEFLTALAGCMEVHIFLMNPCREYWGDIRSGREIARLERREDTPAAEGLLLEEGHPLLASLGRAGRDFFDTVCALECEQEEFFEDVAPDSMLHCLQADILDLRDPAATAGYDLAPGDLSLQLHSCHGPMRELEVLRDRLLGLFEERPDIGPHDILVMAPDIEGYAPYIEAVFDVARGDPTWIPYGISDRSLKRSSLVVKAFFEVLDLAGSRLPASRVYALLESPPVCRRCGIDPADLGRIRDWIEDAGVRWGLDGRSRAGLGLPENDRNTWKAGIERLLLGYAAGGERLWSGILPCDRVEGGLVLGKVLDFMARLFDWTERLQGLFSPGRWAGEFLSLIDDLFAPREQDENDLQLLRTTVTHLADTAAEAGYSGAVGLAVMRAVLDDHLAGLGQRGRFIAGGVTFCSMLPMRSIPFKVICLLGMDHASYPRQSPASGFDLIGRHPRRGDRSRREDDRTLFLEALLSARDRFYISYVGQDVRENKPISPSVLVSELLEVLEVTMARPCTGGKDAPRADDGAELRPGNPATDDPGKDSRAAESSGLDRHRAGLAGAEVPGTEGSRADAPRADAPGSEAPEVETPRADAPRVDTPGVDAHAPDAPVADLVIWRHPLQAHSPEYFTGDGRLFSYSAGNCAAVAGLFEPAPFEPPFQAAPLAAPGDEWRLVSLDDLAAFFAGPAKFLLTRRLGVAFNDDHVELEDREPFILEGLERYELRQFMARRELAGAERQEGYNLLAAAGRLPHGVVGEQAFEKLACEAQQLARRVRAAAGGQEPRRCPLDLSLGGMRLGGRLELYPAGGVVAWRNTPVTAVDRLRTWIAHLAACQLAAGSTAPESCCIGSDMSVYFSAPADPAASLQALLGIYWQGLVEVLPFFARSSYAYAAARRKKDAPAALAAALEAWWNPKIQGGGNIREGDAPAYRLCYGDPARARAGEAPFDGRFEQLAQAVFDELLACGREVKA